MKNLQQQEHFSHHHPLVPLILDGGEKLNCNGCDAQIEEPFHGCIPCNHFLHETCLNTPRFLQHPYHLHPLTLLPTPTYTSRLFTCDACGSDGKSFSLSCAQCECDLHLRCASLPPTLLIRNKHEHNLKLLFGYSPNATFACDICNKIVDHNHWRYFCEGCDFGVHLNCAAPSKTGGGAGGSGSGKEKQENYFGMAINQLEEASRLADEFAATKLKCKIENDTRNSILELWDSPKSSRKKKYYY